MTEVYKKSHVYREVDAEIIGVVLWVRSVQSCATVMSLVLGFYKCEE